MQFKRPGRQFNSEPSLLPLTNIVFLLMIFFLLIGRISEPNAFSVQPPESTSQGPIPGEVLKIELSSAGRIAIDGKRVTRDELAATVRSRRLQTSEQAVQLRADRRDNATDVVRVMRILRDAGVETIRLVTRGS